MEVVLGKFKSKRLRCKVQGCQHPNKEYFSREEKETDVNIAIHLLTDAFNETFDTAFILSADTDLIPAIKKVFEVRQRAKKIVPVVLAAKRINKDGKIVFKLPHSVDLLAACRAKSYYQLKFNELKKHLFSRNIEHNGYTIKMPSEYKSIEDYQSE